MAPNLNPSTFEQELRLLLDRYSRQRVNREACALAEHLVKCLTIYKATGGAPLSDVASHELPAGMPFPPGVSHEGNGKVGRKLRSDPSTRVRTLVRLLTEISTLSPAEAKKRVHQSPLFKEEKGLTLTVARIASRYHEFNAAGLGTDLPGSGDFPDIIMVGIGGRRTNKDAIRDFFQVSDELAARMMEEVPSAEIIAALSWAKTG